MSFLLIVVCSHFRFLSLARVPIHTRRKKAAWASFALLPLVLSATSWPADASSRHGHIHSKTAFHECRNRGRGRVFKGVGSQDGGWGMKTKEGAAAAGVVRTRHGRHSSTARVSLAVASKSTFPGFVAPSRSFLVRSSSGSGAGDGKNAQETRSRSWGTTAAPTSGRGRQGSTSNNSDDHGVAAARMFSSGAGGEEAAAAGSRRLHNSGFFGRAADRVGGSRYGVRQPPQARISWGSGGVPGWSQGRGRGRGAGSSVVVLRMGTGETEYYTW